MNSISLVISGNLTGFSRFYASHNASESLNEAKFDFDYRNYFAFLNSGETAYALSFAPSVLAVSLITRILDSFRRPGVLVVTLLLPRRTKVESVLNPQNKYALYQLLNEINEKFYEKNFLNGMVNQNAAVLMQDYYTEILGNYVLAPDGMQRNINATIEVASPNKRVGYVQASEDSIPLYLASPCRRSFEGCHHVFFAQNPVQHLISEEPVEVVYYRVHVTNNNQVVPSVKLNDKIPNLHPEEGEIDIDKNFTYQQVLNGDAGRNVIADLKGDTIEITYRFGLEEKTIKFLFNENGKEIPFTAIMPLLEYNGTVINIPSETYTFQGKEIYGPKKIKSRGSDYRIKRESETLDLRRLQDTCVIQVEHCFQISVFFNQPDDKQKRITFKNSRGEQYQFNVTNRLDEVLPGYQEDYSYVIESTYYEREAGFLPPSGTQMKLPRLKPMGRIVPPPRPRDPKDGDVHKQLQGTHASGHDFHERRDARPNETHAYSAARQSGGALQLGGGEVNKKPIPKPKASMLMNNKYVVAGGLGICAVLLAIFIFFPSPNENNGDTGYKQEVRILFADCDGKVFESESVFKNLFNFNDSGDNHIAVTVESDAMKHTMQAPSPSDNICYNCVLEVPDTANYYKAFVKIKLLNKVGELKEVLIGADSICSNEFKVSGFPPVYDKKIKLNVKKDEVLAYMKALEYYDKEVELQTKESIVKSANLLSERNPSLGNCILILCKSINVKEEVPAIPQKSVVVPFGELHPAIKEYINKVKQIPDGTIEKTGQLTQDQKRIIDRYNNWWGEQWNKNVIKDNNAKEKIRNSMSQMKTYDGLDKTLREICLYK